jgi:hypothetical protein
MPAFKRFNERRERQAIVALLLPEQGWRLSAKGEQPKGTRAAE